MNADVYSSAAAESSSRAIPFPPYTSAPRRLPPAWRQVVQLIMVAILSLASYLLVTNYVVQSIQVVGRSMQPTLNNSDRLLLNRLVYHLRSPHRFDIVVLKDPAGGYAVKRIIGMGGDTIVLDKGSVYLNGQKLPEPYLPAKTPTFPIGAGPSSFTLAAGSYFVMGDNRLNSADSREYGAVPRQNILGAVRLN